MPVNFQNHFNAAVAHAPVEAGATIQIAPGHPAVGAVAPPRVLARIPAQLATLPARVGRLGARTVVGGAMASVGSVAASNGLIFMLGRELVSFAQNDFSTKRAAQPQDPVLPSVMIGTGVVLGVAGALLMRSARSTVTPEAENQPQTAPSTPCHVDPGSPV